MNDKLLIAGILGLCVCFNAPIASAQQVVGMKMEHASYVHEMPSLYDQDEGVDEEEREVVLFTEEPFFKGVRFLKLDEPLSLRERVDRLLYGVYTDIPPEYDHYGYEIRRYMASIGNALYFENPEFIQKQLKNVNNASIVLEYWSKAHRGEIDKISEIIKEKNDTTSTRTTFKYNRGISNAFMVECQSWIDNNRRVLEFLDEIGPEFYRYNTKTGMMNFRNKQHLREFNNIYTAKIKALKEIRGYMPYRMMVY